MPSLSTLRGMLPAAGPERLELEQHLHPDTMERGRGSGYVADSLLCARWAFEQGPYELTVKSAISLGEDTDTTAAIAGGAAGARDGVAAIPARWREGLRGEEEFRPLLEALCRHRGV
ncbi:MAG: ADP-ribosylglycohydrolase family protein [Myxococcota bacterium]|nr:ADP-ribosylglycohydrolase family protein [Myxococcota bacterium]